MLMRRRVTRRLISIQTVCKGNHDIAASVQRVNPNIDTLDPVWGVKYAKEFKYKHGDIIMSSYPKCGTHWLGNMIWKLKTIDESKRPADALLEYGPPEIFETMDTPRIIMTHLKPNRLPTEHLQNKGKIVVMLRNPKDAMISLYHHLRKAVLFQNKQTLDEFFHSYINGFIMNGSYFDYVQQWEQFLREKPTDQPVEIFYYEDFKANLHYNIARLNNFLGFYRDQQYIERVMKETTLSALRAQDASRKGGTFITVQDDKGDSVIYRKGEVGDWKNYLTAAQSETVDNLLAERLKHGLINIKFAI